MQLPGRSESNACQRFSDPLAGLSYHLSASGWQTGRPITVERARSEQNSEKHPTTCRAVLTRRRAARASQPTRGPTCSHTAPHVRILRLCCCWPRYRGPNPRLGIGHRVEYRLPDEGSSEGASIQNPAGAVGGGSGAPAPHQKTKIGLFVDYLCK